MLNQIIMVMTVPREGGGGGRGVGLSYERGGDARRLT